MSPRPDPSPSAPSPSAASLSGRQLARGICRHLRQRGFATLEEFVPAPGLRVDVAALGPDGAIWVVECKSGRADFRADRKWRGYLPFCDRFLWGVAADFPRALLPEGGGLILADAHDAELLAPGDEHRLSAPRRRRLTAAFARQAALRLQALRDPGITGRGAAPSESPDPLPGPLFASPNPCGPSR